MHFAGLDAVAYNLTVFALGLTGLALLGAYIFNRFGVPRAVRGPLFGLLFVGALWLLMQRL